MNTGIIASRYAGALLLLTQESGRGEQVCAQARALLADPSAPTGPLEKDLEQLVVLLKKNGRLDYLKFVLSSFVDKYCESAGLCLANLVTAVPAPGLDARLSDLIGSLTGLEVMVESSVDPSVMGGFTLEVDNHLFDASVRTELETIRRELIEKNTRIV